MPESERLRIYDLLSSTVNRRPRESLNEASRRYLRYGTNTVRKRVARAILDVGERRWQAAWDALADAADIVRPYLVH